jgi:hypothetical protein
MKVVSLPTTKERSWMFKEMLMLKTETSLPTRNTEDSTSNGTLSMLTNGRVNQSKENSMKNSASMSKDHSTLSLP